MTACPEYPIISPLYSVWSGDDLRRMKWAERVAWSIENAIAAEDHPIGARIGSVEDLARRFNAGTGVIREALEILAYRDICAVRRGPRGGVLVSESSTSMTAQAVANYLRRVQVSPDHWRQAEAFRASVSAEDRRNPWLVLFTECVNQLRPCVGESLEERGEPQLPSTAPGQASRIRWRRYSTTPLSRARHVGWTIAERVAHDLADVGATHLRLGSEEDLRIRYGVSRATMRQATRLLETCGIVDSLPGRGRGLMASKPNAIPVIRRIDSHLLSLRTSGEDTRIATEAFGDVALRSSICTLSPSSRARLSENLAALTRAGPDGTLMAARAVLRSLMETARNPVFTLFWLASAGFTFRAFCEADVLAQAPTASLTDRVAGILDAALSGDIPGAAAAYRAIFPARGMTAWSR